MTREYIKIHLRRLVWWRRSIRHDLNPETHYAHRSDLIRVLITELDAVSETKASCSVDLHKYKDPRQAAKVNVSVRRRTCDPSAYSSV